MARGRASFLLVLAASWNLFVKVARTLMDLRDQERFGRGVVVVGSMTALAWVCGAILTHAAAQVFLLAFSANWTTHGFGDILCVCLHAGNLVSFYKQQILSSPYVSSRARVSLPLEHCRASLSNSFPTIAS